MSSGTPGFRTRAPGTHSRRHGGCPRRRRREPRQRDRSVITSYSIHYTKLYDCLLCHDEQMTPDLSGATAWNSTGAEIAEVYPQQMAAAASSLADSCRDCHQGHYDSGFHHPVDVRYPPTSTGVSEFIDNPDGVHLVCGSEGECQVSCVSCHNVHPTEQAAVEDTSYNFV